jgi:hypothetical protein
MKVTKVLAQSAQGVHALPVSDITSALVRTASTAAMLLSGKAGKTVQRWKSEWTT